MIVKKKKKKLKKKRKKKLKLIFIHVGGGGLYRQTSVVRLFVHRVPGTHSVYTVQSSSVVRGALKQCESEEGLSSGNARVFVYGLN